MLHSVERSPAAVVSERVYQRVLIGQERITPEVLAEPKNQALELKLQEHFSSGPVF